jgi:hypothetical protein
MTLTIAQKVNQMLAEISVIFGLNLSRWLKELGPASASKLRVNLARHAAELLTKTEEEAETEETEKHPLYDEVLSQLKNLDIVVNTLLANHRNFAEACWILALLLKEAGRDHSWLHTDIAVEALPKTMAAAYIRYGAQQGVNVYEDHGGTIDPGAVGQLVRDVGKYLAQNIDNCFPARGLSPDPSDAAVRQSALVGIFEDPTEYLTSLEDRIRKLRDSFETAASTQDGTERIMALLQFESTRRVTRLQGDAMMFKWDILNTSNSLEELHNSIVFSTEHAMNGFTAEDIMPEEIFVIFQPTTPREFTEEALTEIAEAVKKDVQQTFPDENYEATLNIPEHLKKDHKYFLARTFLPETVKEEGFTGFVKHQGFATKTVVDLAYFQKYPNIVACGFSTTVALPPGSKPKPFVRMLVENRIVNYQNIAEKALHRIIHMWWKSEETARIAIPFTRDGDKVRLVEPRPGAEIIDDDEDGEAPDTAFDTQHFKDIVFDDIEGRKLRRSTVLASTRENEENVMLLFDLRVSIQLSKPNEGPKQS